jgi:hypothetical protein
MAQSTVPALKAKKNSLFADNKFFKTKEVDFRDIFEDLIDSFVAKGAANVPDYLAGTNYPAGYLILHSFAGGPGIFLDAAQAGYLPAPTDPAGDANWLPALAPAPDNATFQFSTVAALRRASGQWVQGRLYILLGRLDAQGHDLADVYVRALSPTQLEPEGYTLGGVTLVKVHYELATDTTTPVRTASAFADLLGVPEDNAALAAVLAGKASKQDIADLIGAAPEALNTLAEIDAQLQADEAGAAAILATLNQHTTFIGTMSALFTTAKSSLVAAVNELFTSLATKAPLASPALTGLPTVPTAVVGTNNEQAANTAFVQIAQKQGELGRLTNAAYYVSYYDQTLKGSSTLNQNLLRLQAEVVANGGGFSVAPALVCLSRLSAQNTVTTLSFNLAFRLAGDYIDGAEVVLVSGGRLLVNASKRVKFTGDGTLVATDDAGGAGVFLQIGSAQVLEIDSTVRGSAPPSLTLVSFNVVAWTNPLGLAVTVYLQGTTTIPGGALPAGVTVVEQRNAGGTVDLSNYYNKTQSDARYALAGSSTSPGGSTTVTAYLQIRSISNVRVAEIPVLSPVTVLEEIFDENVQAVEYQLDLKTRSTGRVYGTPGLPRADILTALNALSAADYAAGVKLYARSVVVSPPDPATLILKFQYA